jgi:hypothetical protein
MTLSATAALPTQGRSGAFGGGHSRVNGFVQMSGPPGTSVSGDRPLSVASLPPPSHPGSGVGSYHGSAFEGSGFGLMQLPAGAHPGMGYGNDAGPPRSLPALGASPLHAAHVPFHPASVAGYLASVQATTSDKAPPGWEAILGSAKGNRAGRPDITRCDFTAASRMTGAGTWALASSHGGTTSTAGPGAGTTAAALEGQDAVDALEDALDRLFQNKVCYKGVG